MPFTSEELKNKRIGVLLGGLSAERDVSLSTGTAVLRALNEKSYSAKLIDVGRNIAAQLQADPIDVAFIALHGRYGEDGCIQGLLESMFIPYTGSGVLASAAAMDKVFTKRIFKVEGIPIAPYVVVPKDGPFTVAQIPFGLPCVVKPSREGSSVGVHIVKTEAELAPAVADAARFGSPVLVEKYVKGKEINVGVLFGEALGVIEIVPSREFYDYTAKYTAGLTQYHFPARISAEETTLLLDIAVKACGSLGCDGGVRADFILGDDGQPIVLEVNTLPGMTATSLLPKMAAGRGIDFGTLCERLLCGASLKA
jgi:D-alanine-D-alanine ligase